MPGAGGGAEEVLKALSILAPVWGYIALASVLLFAGGAFQKAFIIAASGKALDGDRPAFRSTLKECLPGWGRIMVQDIAVSFVGQILASIIAFAIIIPYVLANLSLFENLKSSDSSSMMSFIFSIMGIYILMLLAVEAAVWWLKVKTSVSGPASIRGAQNSISGIGSSISLVKGQSWRVFGIMFIVELIIGFAVGILSGPFTFAAILPGYVNTLKLEGATKQEEARTIAKMFSSLGSTAALSALITGVVKGGLWPIFLTLLHDDLSFRARRGDGVGRLYGIAGIRAGAKRPAGAAASVARALSFRAPPAYISDSDDGEDE